MAESIKDKKIEGNDYNVKDGQDWEWWDEKKTNKGKKWKTLEHYGPVFEPPYHSLPASVRLLYNGKPVKLSLKAEEVACFYAKLLMQGYKMNPVFKRNFFEDWKKIMTKKDNELIKNLEKCDFINIETFLKEKAEERKNISKEEQLKRRNKQEDIKSKYGYCIVDGHQEKIANYKIELGGIFLGRGEHPKKGKVKKRIMPEDVIINCGKDSQIPKPPRGHNWKAVCHDDTVSWLASWTENIHGQNKYVMLNPSSRLRGVNDWQKYETARKLNKYVKKIRRNYRSDWSSKDMLIKQRGVALYFIDKLALRAGNEKEGMCVDTVGCCSLRVEHVDLYDEFEGKKNVVLFDFPGKDSIRYQNTISVDPKVFNNLDLFMQNKEPGDDLFDELNTHILNKHLQDLMEGLTAKVFRTYNASKTLETMLNKLTKASDPVTEKLLAYNRANRAAAILCNHYKSTPKSFDKQVKYLKCRITDKTIALQEAEEDLDEAEEIFHNSKSHTDETKYINKWQSVHNLNNHLSKLNLQLIEKEENKDIALGTSKMNYLDPRITVAWCKKWKIPIEKIYTLAQRERFSWAIKMACPNFVF